MTMWEAIGVGVAVVIFAWMVVSPTLRRIENKLEEIRIQLWQQNNRPPY